MKGYGLKKADVGCCPGHDKYSRWAYTNSNRKTLKKCARSAKKRERRLNKII